VSASTAEDAAGQGVVARVSAVLGAFATAPAEGLTLTQLTERCRLPLTTVHRLCGQLERERVLERSPDGRYRIGLKLWELGMLAPRGHGLREIALPYLEDLYEVTHENVQLLVLDGTEVVVVERLRARNAVQLRSRPGGRLPAHATSGGIVLLPSAPETLEALADGPFERFTAETIADGEQLRSAVTLARRQGWCELRGHLTPGSVSIAAAVVVRGRAVAAVSVVGEIDADSRPLIPALLTTSRAIGRALSADRSG
jgi:DNA-binding IclR family transcriptional regulator